MINESGISLPPDIDKQSEALAGFIASFFIKQIKEELIPNLRVEMGALKVKAGIWAAVTGIIGGALAFAGERFMPK